MSVIYPIIYAFNESNEYSYQKLNDEPKQANNYSDKLLKTISDLFNYVINLLSCCRPRAADSIATPLLSSTPKYTEDLYSPISTDLPSPPSACPADDAYVTYGYYTSHELDSPLTSQLDSETGISEESESDVATLDSESEESESDVATLDSESERREHYINMRSLLLSR